MTESSKLHEWSENVSLLCKTTLDLPPSCLEFVPAPGHREEASSHFRSHYHEYFVVGTYYLEKEEGPETVLDPEKEVSGGDNELLVTSKPQSKNGSLILFRYRDKKLHMVQALPYPSAVFDLHFLPNSSVFAIVSSAGNVTIFKIVDTQGSDATGNLGIKTLATHQVFTDDISPTFFSWAPHSQRTMGITTSDGVYLVHFSADYASFMILNNGEAVIKHSEYAWCCTFSPSGDRLYSGGDDNKIRLENLGSALTNLDPVENIDPSGLYTKGLPGHDAGVTFILPIPLQISDEESQFLLTGSYDDRIRVYLLPAYPSRPKVLKEFYLGGGVWRLKFLDATPAIQESSASVVTYTVLASCMHAGAKILSVVGRKQQGEEIEWSWEITALAEMSLHKSMNYASDVQEADKEKKGRTLVSSSFYDRLLCVWEWEPDEATNR